MSHTKYKLNANLLSLLHIHELKFKTFKYQTVHHAKCTMFYNAILSYDIFRLLHHDKIHEHKMSHVL